MNTKFRYCASTLAVATAALFGAQAALAADVDTTTQLQFAYNGGNANGGGEFLASVVSGAGTSFATYCLEDNENISLGVPFQVAGVTNHAVKGGLGYSDGTGASIGAILDTFSGAGSSDSSMDYLSYSTAWLYTQVVKDPSAISFTGTDAQKNAVQQAIWFMEDERASGLGTDSWGSLASLAQNYVTQAYNAVNGGAWGATYGDVKVLNMTTLAGGRAQDQLYLPVPEPETYAMLLAGLGLMGFIARRRRTKDSA